MIGDLLCSQAERHNDSRVAIVAGTDTASWCRVADLISAYRDRYASLSHSRLGLCLRPNPHGIALLAALDYLQCDTTLLDANLQGDSLRHLAQRLGLATILTERNDARDEDDKATWRMLDLGPQPNTELNVSESAITILTSGTTGEPKAVRHTWQSLCRPVRFSSRTDTPVWILTFRPHLYAGLQVVLQCFALGGTLTSPSEGATPQEIVEFMAQHRVAYASATPSYWRRLILFADHTTLQTIPLRQITLGGEIADQLILDQLRATFPNTRISHIYATTELGRCFSVTDGMAGFPASYLSSELPDNVSLRVHDGELLVRSANATQIVRTDQSEDKQEWFATGDQVEFQRDRYYFRGRLSDMINVGGNKVNPATVEEAIRAMPEVADVRVYAVPSSVAGQLVGCDVVGRGIITGDELRTEVSRVCRDRLASFQVPRVIQVVDEIGLTTSGKVRRTAPPS